MTDSKKPGIFNSLNSQCFSLQFQELVLGLERSLRGASMWFRQAVRHELKKGPKTQKRASYYLSLLLTYLLWIQLTAVAHRH